MRAVTSAKVSLLVVPTTRLAVGRQRAVRRARMPLVWASRQQSGQESQPHMTRRELATSIFTAAGLQMYAPGPSQAFEVKDLGDDAQATREQLLECISQGGSEAEVQAALTLLAKFNPTPDPARSPQLQGNWKLLWSSQGAEVTKATRNLPVPFTSMQLIGPGGGEGQPGGPLPAGRAANIVKVLDGGITLKLSSSAIPDSDQGDAVIIGPPFRLELLVGSRSIPIQAEETTESDTSTILGNQLNTFTQLYLESTGEAGDLRVSQVTAGDPVVLGSTFVHVRV